MKLLQTILIILVVYVSIRLLWRLFGKQILKWLGMKALQKVQKSFESRMGGAPDPSRSTTQSSRPQSRSNQPFREKKKVGEYVDFEEID